MSFALAHEAFLHLPRRVLHHLAYAECLQSPNASLVPRHSSIDPVPTETILEELDRDHQACRQWHQVRPSLHRVTITKRFAYGNANSHFRLRNAYDGNVNNPLPITHALVLNSVMDHLFLHLPVRVHLLIAKATMRF